MSEKQLTEKESLALITEMISKAKSNYQRGGSFQFLLWGWVMMLANFGHYFLEAFTDYPHPYIVWAIGFPAGIVSAIHSSRMSKNALVVGHLDRTYGHIWIAVGVGIVITLLSMSRLGYNHNAIILLLAGMGTYITGQLLRFRPLMWGGVALAVASVIAFNVEVTDQYLVGGFGLFVGYLIPGYLLKSKEK